MTGQKRENTKSIFKRYKSNSKVDDDVTYEEFFNVVRCFNRLISKEILDGYKFSSCVGSLSIAKIYRKKRAINWGESNRKKRLIIASGKIPFNKKTAPKGEQWFIYYTDPVNYLWWWEQPDEILAWYAFIPCITNLRCLGKVVKEKINNNIEEYAPVIQNSFKPIHNIQDFKDIQAVRF